MSFLDKRFSICHSILMIILIVLGITVCLIVIAPIIAPPDAESEDITDSHTVNSQTFRESMNEINALDGITASDRKYTFLKAFIQGKGWIAAGLICKCCIE